MVSISIVAILKVSCGVFIHSYQLPAFFVAFVGALLIAYLCALQPPIRQWNSVKSLCIASSAHTCRCVLVHMHKTDKMGAHMLKKNCTP